MIRFAAAAMPAPPAHVRPSRGGRVRPHDVQDPTAQARSDVRADLHPASVLHHRGGPQPCGTVGAPGKRQSEMGFTEPGARQQDEGHRASINDRTYYQLDRNFISDDAFNLDRVGTTLSSGSWHEAH